MDCTLISLSGMTLHARPSGALWWPEASILIVSDLHLGRSERLARRGDSLLPPYDSMETISRRATARLELVPKSVICLGDSFDDPRAAEELDDGLRRRISSLMAGRRWIWIAGNHDPHSPSMGGSFMEEVVRGPLTFRHIAHPRAEAGEVSGHYHPKVHVPTRAGRVTKPCFVELPGNPLIW